MVRRANWTDTELVADALQANNGLDAQTAYLMAMEAVDSREIYVSIRGATRAVCIVTRHGEYAEFAEFHATGALRGHMRDMRDYIGAILARDGIHNLFLFVYADNPDAKRLVGIYQKVIGVEIDAYRMKMEV